MRCSLFVSMVCCAMKSVSFTQEPHFYTVPFIGFSLNPVVYFHPVYCNLILSHSSDSRSNAECLQVNGFIKLKHSLEEVDAALESAPIYVSNLHKLVEGVAAAKIWRQKFAESCSPDQDVELKTLESLVAEGSRLPILIPELKVNLLSKEKSVMTMRQYLDLSRNHLSLN